MLRSDVVDHLEHLFSSSGVPGNRFVYTPYTLYILYTLAPCNCRLRDNVDCVHWDSEGFQSVEGADVDELLGGVSVGRIAINNHMIAF